MTEDCFEHCHIESLYLYSFVIVTKIVVVKNYWMFESDFLVDIFHQYVAVRFTDSGSRLFSSSLDFSSVDEACCCPRDLCCEDKLKKKLVISVFVNHSSLSKQPFIAFIPFIPCTAHAKCHLLRVNLSSRSFSLFKLCRQIHPYFFGEANAIRSRFSKSPYI